MRGIWAGALLVCYLAGGAVLLVVGSERAPAGALSAHLLLLAALVIATFVPAVPRWLRPWAPLLALLFLYSEMPLLIAAAGHGSVRDVAVIGWEQALFGGQPAREWAARWPGTALSEILHGAYLSYYAIIFVIPVVLQLRGRAGELSDAVFVLMLTFVVCFVWYLFFPVAGPRYSGPAAASPSAGPLRALTIWLLEARSSRGTAFPSSHVAVSVTQCILAVRYFGARGAWLILPTMLLAAGAVYGGFHYAVDIVAGAAVGAVSAFLGVWLTRARQANATAPT